MRSRYFFDKRDMKRGFAKYGIIFLISFIPLIIFNVFAYKYIGIRWLIVLLDCVILLVLVAIGNSIAKKIFERKDAKLQAKMKAREDMQKRKKQILEDSYKRKREEKQKAKEKAKQEENIVVEISESDNVKETKDDEAKEETEQKVTPSQRKKSKKS